VVASNLHYTVTRRSREAISANKAKLDFFPYIKFYPDNEAQGQRKHKLINVFVAFPLLASCPSPHSIVM